LSGKFYEPVLPRNGRDSKWSRLYPSNLEAKREIHALRHLGNSKTRGSGSRKSAANRFTLIRIGNRLLAAIIACQPIISTGSQPGSWRLPAPLANTGKAVPRNHATSSLSQHHPRDPGTSSQNVITRRKSGKCPAGACQFNAPNGSLGCRFLRRQRAFGSRPCPPLARALAWFNPSLPFRWSSAPGSNRTNGAAD
jgi:hypothetical protein